MYVQFSVSHRPLSRVIAKLSGTAVVGLQLTEQRDAVLSPLKATMEYV